MRTLFILLCIVCRQVLATDWFTPAKDELALMQPVANLSDSEMDLFTLGRSFFTIPWVAAPSATTARDGLGPLFNANTCATCHTDNSSGVIFAKDGVTPRHSLVMKLGQPSKHHLRDETQMLIPDPVYGGQVAILSTGEVHPEAKVALEKVDKSVTFADGSTTTLTRYEPRLEHLGYGDIDKDSVLTLRQPPPLVGLGLIERLSDEAILANADPDDSKQNGIRGRPNWVYEPLQEKVVLGRLGHKASQANAMMQTADAAANDMGLTNPYFPEELCTPAQTACLQAPRGRVSPMGDLDLPMLRLTGITFFITHFKAPKTKRLNATEQQGKVLFSDIGCVACHVDNFTTTDGINFAPYSDFLLHDLGADLADGRAEFLAQPQDWRTAPLWGMAQRVLTDKHFLHDGRAATPLEAILWHGGEAAPIKDNFMALSSREREAVLQFLETL